ncbi:hypothetical protein IGI04_000571 [Brassica rapa subsp. trilocularis]|uniref:PPPDE domain-containing protein n=1 Tax=Brassica rapa subsp. trilocularis TaxID=1813537 RepID=A0ABQ7NQA4_BRACM|nr:hypothetical protein IGI04_000571 [Brassica rapa subsp. trilocularis]
MMFCRNVCVRRKKKKNPGSVPVYLNVYDLTPMNVYGYWLGIGIYHSGLEVHGVEYGYGAHEHSSTGIFKVEPKKCPGFTFRKSILVGETEMKAKEIGSFMEELADEYQGSKYHLITRNCNHFCNDVCLKLTQKSIPSWVNRLARLGFLCNCVLPASLNEMKVKQVGKDGKLLEVGESKKNKKKKKQKKARSRSGPLASSSDSRLDNNKPSHARSISTGESSKSAKKCVNSTFPLESVYDVEVFSDQSDISVTFFAKVQSVMEDQTKDSVAWLDQRKPPNTVPQVVYDKEEAGQEDEAKQAYSPLDSSSYRQHYQVQCQAQALAQNQARILSESSRLFVFCSI